MVVEALPTKIGQTHFSDPTAVQALIRENSTLDRQDNLFASPQFLSLFVRQIPAAGYVMETSGDAVLMLRSDGTAVANYYVEHASPLTSVQTNAREAALELFRRPLRMPVIQLQPLADTSLFRDLPGWYTREFDCHENWYLPCEGMRFDQYLAKHGNSQWSRKLKKFPGTLALENDETGIAAYEEVYARSWKKPEPYPDFVPELIRMAMREGWLRLGIARIDGKPIGAQLWLVRHGTAYMYKIAYVEGDEFKKLSPGMCLMMLLMRHVLDVDQVREVDFGIGADSYKKEWMTHVRKRKGVVLCRLNHPRGILRAAREWAGTLRKR